MPEFLGQLLSEEDEEAGTPLWACLSVPGAVQAQHEHASVHSELGTGTSGCLDRWHRAAWAVAEAVVCAASWEGPSAESRSNWPTNC
jgi:hypothetical protein